MTPTCIQSLDSCQQLFLLRLSQKKENKIYFSYFFSKFGGYLSMSSVPSIAPGTGDSPMSKSQSPCPQGADFGVPRGGRLETSKETWQLLIVTSARGKQKNCVTVMEDAFGRGQITR